MRRELAKILAKNCATCALRIAAKTNFESARNQPLDKNTEVYHDLSSSQATTSGGNSTAIKTLDADPKLYEL